MERNLRLRIALCLATLCGAGYSPLMPGTAGTAVGVALSLPFLKLSLPWRLFVLCAVVGVAVYAAGKAGPHFGDSDDGRIVIDELAGYLAAVAWFQNDWRLWVWAFVFFRIFDIFKPFPISLIDRRWKSASGTVADDVLAGVFAAISIWIGHRLWPGVFPGAVGGM